MALTDHERQILNELEAGLRHVSDRPRWSHVVAGTAAHRRLAIPIAVILAGLIVLLVLYPSALTALPTAAAGIAAYLTAAVIARDIRNRAAGD